MLTLDTHEKLMILSHDSLFRQQLGLLPIFGHTYPISSNFSFQLLPSLPSIYLLTKDYIYLLIYKQQDDFHHTESTAFSHLDLPAGGNVQHPNARAPEPAFRA